jgi:hypothetical protein
VEITSLNSHSTGILIGTRYGFLFLCSAFAELKVMQSNQSQNANQIHGVVVHFDAQYCFQNSDRKINQKKD